MQLSTRPEVKLMATGGTKKVKALISIIGSKETQEFWNRTLNIFKYSNNQQNPQIELNIISPSSRKAHIHGLLVLCLCQPGKHPDAVGGSARTGCTIDWYQQVNHWEPRGPQTLNFSVHQHLAPAAGRRSNIDGQTTWVNFTWKEPDAKRVAAPCEAELAGWHVRSNPKLWPQELRLDKTWKKMKKN